MPTHRPEVTAHTRLAVFETYGDRVQPTITFATVGYWPAPGWQGSNRLPHHRLFVVFADAQQTHAATTEAPAEHCSWFPTQLPYH